MNERHVALYFRVVVECGHVEDKEYETSTMVLNACNSLEQINNELRWWRRNLHQGSAVSEFGTYQVLLVFVVERPAKESTSRSHAEFEFNFPLPKSSKLIAPGPIIDNSSSLAMLTWLVPIELRIIVKASYLLHLQTDFLGNSHALFLFFTTPGLRLDTALHSVWQRCPSKALVFPDTCVSRSV